MPGRGLAGFGGVVHELSLLGQVRRVAQVVTRDGQQKQGLVQPVVRYAQEMEGVAEAKMRCSKQTQGLERVVMRCGQQTQGGGWLVRSCWRRAWQVAGEARTYGQRM
jgi:hypothetical protein